MENELELKVGDVVRLKPLTVRQIGPDGDVFFKGYRGLVDVEAIESIISYAETDAEKIARLTDQLADAKNVIKTQEAELDKTPRKIEWNGGECPVNKDAQVLVWYRNGEKFMARAFLCAWGHDQSISDIIAYMVIPE